MNRNRRSWVQVAALALAMSLAAACSDVDEALNGPDDFPTNSEMGMMAVAMDSVLSDYFVANSGSFESLEALGPLFGTGFSIVPLVAAPATASGGPEGMEYVMRLAQLSPQSIPSEALGTTYSYNPSTGNYESTEQTGAPANGVRFLLYEVSGSTPVTPLNEIGHLDVALTSPPPSVSMSIDLVIDDVTVLHLGPSGSVLPDVVNLNIPGYLSDPSGSSQLNFDAGISGSPSAPNIWYTLFPMANAELNYSSWIDTSSGTQQISILLSVEQSVDLFFSMEVFVEADLSGNINWGRAYVWSPTTLVADISGTLNNPTVTGIEDEEGAPFPSEEVPALVAVFQALRQIHSALASYFSIGIGLLTAGLS